MAENGKWRNRIIERKRVRVGDLAANKYNPKTHPASQQTRIEAVLDKFGVVEDLIAYYSQRNGGALTLFDGHARQKLDPEQEWDVVVTDLTDAEVDELVFYFDPLAGMSLHDEAKMAALMQDLGDVDGVLGELLGELAEGVGLAFGGDGDGLEDPGPQLDRAAELQEVWQVKRGQVWEIPSHSVPGKAHKIMCGDSTDAGDMEGLVEGIKADALTDPPYNVGFDYGKSTDDKRAEAKYWEWQSAWFSLLTANTRRQVITPGCVNLEGWITRFFPKHVAVWDKGEGANTHGRVTKYWAWEPIMCHGKFERIRHTDVFRVSALGENPGHPCPKPVALWVDILQTLATAQDIVDPFLGSGTTLVACEQTGRIGYGMEIEPKYCAVSLDRLQRLGLEPRLVEG